MYVTFWFYTGRVDLVNMGSEAAVLERNSTSQLQIYNVTPIEISDLFLFDTNKTRSVSSYTFLLASYNRISHLNKLSRTKKPQ